MQQQHSFGCRRFGQMFVEASELRFVDPSPSQQFGIAGIGIQENQFDLLFHDPFDEWIGLVGHSEALGETMTRLEE